MFRTKAHLHRVAVIACSEKPSCFRWIIHAPGGGRSERSSYAFATEAGALASGRSWRRAFEAGQSLA